jgi:lysophospholipase L1-like esterase
VTGYDVVFVCGGTNDYGNNVTGDTFKAAYTEVVETLMANNAEVICCTPIYRHNRQGANTQGLWLVDYADMIKEVAETKGLKVIDLLKLTSNSNMPRYMPDGLHPNEKGHKIMADWIVSECDRLGL